MFYFKVDSLAGFNSQNNAGLGKCFFLLLAKIAGPMKGVGAG